MLLIGDIHITSKYSDSILGGLRAFVHNHPDEKSVIFVGDYVYHFSYDRKALLQLFSFFLELVKQGKDVYVMSGNHDWIQEHFVYAESAHAMEVFSPYISGSSGSIEFITEICWRTIEDKQMLFVPFYLLDDQERGGSFDALLESANKGEQQSGRVNTIIERELQILHPSGTSFNKEEQSDVYMIHHRYIADQVFPGQQAKFTYKSPALSPIWLDSPGIKMISGHLHQPFSYKNYCCVGSVRYTSPLEYNQMKFAFVLRDDGLLYAEHLVINPYIHGSLTELSSSIALECYIQSLYAKALVHFSSPQRMFTSSEMQPVALPTLSLTIRDDTLGYDTLQDVLDPAIFNAVSDLSIKKQAINMEEFVSLLETGSKQLTESIADRKTLLLEYIRNKYGERSDIYEEELRRLKLI